MVMEAVVLVAIGVLTVVFVGSLLALILVCRHKYCRPLDMISHQFKDVRPEINLITNEDNADLELDDVRLHPNIEKILTDEQWVDDATGLIPHCLAILKKCHHLTERLVAMMMTYVSQHSNQDLGEIIEVAKKISPRVDDVVKAMYPPLDPRLLEARCIALILSVSHLALVTKTLCQWQSCNWIEAALKDMDDNILVLKEASINMENSASQLNGSVPSDYSNGVTSNNFVAVHNVGSQNPIAPDAC